MSRFYFVNDAIVPAEKALLSVTDLSVMRGYGIFDYFRVIKNRPFLIQDYLDRFYNSAAMTNLEAPLTRDELLNVIDDLIRKNNKSVGGIRLILTGGYSHNSFDVPAKPNFIILFEDFIPPPADYYQKGIKLMTYQYKREFSSIKSINYFTVINLRNQIKQQNASDVLYYHDNNVLEVSRSNFFAVINETIVTPSRDILYGVTRKKVLELASQKWNVEEREISLQEALSAEEIFVTGTTRKVTPVTNIDDQVIGNGNPGKISKDLLRMFENIEHDF